MAHDDEDIDMQSSDAVEEEKQMYGSGAMTEQELDEKYPNRPHNHSKTIPFHHLFTTLFNPLNDNKKKGPAINRKKLGPHGGPGQNPNDVRRQIIDRFIGRWRKDVGNDIYPAFRLIVPEKDRDRGMYGIKEMTLAKLLIKVMIIDKNSEDGYNLVNWKLPGVKSSSTAGDFAGRCFEVISKRAMRSDPGDMTVGEVNVMLDKLSVAQKEEHQRPIIEAFYSRMNAEEMMWLIRMILRQMKVGATERTFFGIWHPDAENLFNISSSLRRVCWELYDPRVRLEGDNCGISLMQCFQPQLAAFQMRSIEQMVAKMNPTEEDSVFWIEEKLDGERMQLHMVEDDDHPGGKRFCFWSRKAKDYTYLYGNGFEDDKAALTRHLKDAFNPGVRNIILDGEMITWDPNEDCAVSFGTLKTAALMEQQNPFAGGERPLFRVFDCLYLNDRDLTRYTLRDRRKALSDSIDNVHRRLEVHEYHEGRKASEVEEILRKVVAEASEGLVLKNPRSEYRLNDRNDDWIKVKPEYMTEFGESLDCIVVGGYYGSGKRGGGISSFLCGLYVSESEKLRNPSINDHKCWSFFKVGGGFSASDYAQIRHRIGDKWQKWDSRRPPTDWIELAGGDRQHEKPDVWIRPQDSVVLSVKAASVAKTDQFRTNKTLRFPRFKRLRTDKSWDQALTLDQFYELQSKAELEQKEKKIKIDESRKNRTIKRQKKELVIQGQEDDVKVPYAGPATKVFEGLSFFIMTEAAKPIKKNKAELEQLVKANGGSVVASQKDPNTVIIADRNLVKVASIKKNNNRNIIKPRWLLDCIKQSEADLGKPSLLLPLEPNHLEFTKSADEGKFDDNVDEYGDSYTRDMTSEDLLALLEKMPEMVEEGYEPVEILDQLKAHHEREFAEMAGFVFHGAKGYFEGVSTSTIRLFEFAGGVVTKLLDDPDLEVVVVSQNCRSVGQIRKALSTRARLPRIVTDQWVTDSWIEETRLDEEKYAPR